MRAHFLFPVTQFKAIPKCLGLILFGWFSKAIYTQNSKTGPPRAYHTGYQEIWKTKLNKIHKEWEKIRYTIPNGLLNYPPCFLVWNTSFIASKYSEFPPPSPGGCLIAHFVNISKIYIQNNFYQNENNLKSWFSTQWGVTSLQEQILCSCF